LIALTSFYSPVRRKACGYLFLTPRRQKILSESLRLGVEKSGRGRRQQPRPTCKGTIPTGLNPSAQGCDSYPGLYAKTIQTPTGFHQKAAGRFNPFRVDDFHGTFTQGSACGTTLG
jgi:hypothetical protein